MSVTIADINRLIQDRVGAGYGLKRRRNENDQNFTNRILIAAWLQEAKQHAKLVKWLRGKKPVKIVSARIRVPIKVEAQL